MGKKDLNNQNEMYLFFRAKYSNAVRFLDMSARTGKISANAMTWFGPPGQRLYIDRQRMLYG
jgi:hypothetical protein